MALKNVSINEPFFHGPLAGTADHAGRAHRRGARAGGRRLDRHERDPGPDDVALIASIDGVKLRRPVVPGDQLRLEVVGHRIKASAAVVTGQARVGDALAAEAQLRFVMVEAERAPAGVDRDACDRADPGCRMKTIGCGRSARFRKLQAERCGQSDGGTLAWPL